MVVSSNLKLFFDQIGCCNKQMKKGVKGVPFRHTSQMPLQMALLVISCEQPPCANVVAANVDQPHKKKEETLSCWIGQSLVEILNWWTRVDSPINLKGRIPNFVHGSIPCYVYFETVTGLR